MSRNQCTDCHTQIPSGQKVGRSINLQRVELCKSCAEFRGWVPVQRGPLSVESVALGVAEVELYANHARR